MRAVAAMLRRSSPPYGELPSVTPRADVAIRAGHQAGVLFLATGLISLIYDLLPNDLGSDWLAAIIVDGATVLVGLVIRATPWGRLHPRWLSVLPAAALVYLAVNRMLGVVPDETYGIWIILVFVWIGLWQMPGRALMMAPFAVATYLAPFAVIGVPGDGTLAAIAISVPVATIVGETLSRRAAAVARADSERQVALDALAQANVTDDLTGLGNRRFANQMLDTLDDRDALAIFDLDHFKNVNDTLGHDYGDRVLAELGQFLRDNVRPHDAVARYGGEEFIMVLHGAGPAAIGIIERLLDLWRQRGPATTLSVGVAVHHGRSWSTTFRCADQALYAAKKEGRNRVVLDCPGATQRDAAQL